MTETGETIAPTFNVRRRGTVIEKDSFEKQ